MTSRNTLLTSEGVTLKKDNATSTAANTVLIEVNNDLRLKIAEFEQHLSPPTSMPISMLGSVYAMPPSNARQPIHTASRLHASKGDEHQITAANEVLMYCYKVSHNHLQEVRNKEPTIANKTEKAALTTENAAVKAKVDTLPVAAATTRSHVSHIRHRSLLHTYLHDALSIIAHIPNPNLN